MDATEALIDNLLENPAELDALEKRLKKQLGEEEFTRQIRMQAVTKEKRAIDVGDKKPMMDGLGQLTHVIPLRDYLRAQRVDRHFWNSKDNMRWAENRWPEIQL